MVRKGMVPLNRVEPDPDFGTRESEERASEDSNNQIYVGLILSQRGTTLALRNILKFESGLIRRRLAITSELVACIHYRLWDDRSPKVVSKQ
ncbi:hypothetical protein Syun_000942 [Stephania yunnanensis]|uniref:Uncharacterized protein n=1 Tax=Stephania yunnanensis TaxID=152371 RepID=A0AAP0Q5T3_9MAGN